MSEIGDPSEPLGPGSREFRYAIHPEHRGRVLRGPDLGVEFRHAVHPDHKGCIVKGPELTFSTAIEESGSSPITAENENVVRPQED